MLTNAMYQINDQCGGIRIKLWRSLTRSYRLQKNCVTPTIQKEVVRLSEISKESLTVLPIWIRTCHRSLPNAGCGDVFNSARSENPDPQNVDLLKAISDAIVVGNPERTSVEFAAEMTQMVRELQ